MYVAPRQTHVQIHPANDERYTHFGPAGALRRFPKVYVASTRSAHLQPSPLLISVPRPPHVAQAMQVRIRGLEESHRDVRYGQVRTAGKPRPRRAIADDSRVA